MTYTSGAVGGFQLGLVWQNSVLKPARAELKGLALLTQLDSSNRLECNPGQLLRDLEHIAEFPCRLLFYRAG